MDPGGMRPETTEQYWRDLIAEQERSGQTVRAFAEERGLSAWSLYGWRSRLGRGRGATGRGSRRRRRPPAEAEQALVAVDVTGASRPAAEEADAFELELEGGVRVRVPRGFDGEELARLLSAVRTSC